MEENTGMSIFKPGALNIENPLQNQEEAEELEDQKRRQEEIQNLLTVAMDDFNYDDSTINSSGNASSAEDTNLMQKYRNASYDDQLKVLYDVRVKEVKSLSEELDKVKQELLQQRDSYMKKLMLMEADKNQATMSLEQSQNLLVSKTEEINRLHSEFDKLNANIAALNKDMQKLSQENDIMKHTNSDLMEQLTMMQKGLATTTINENHIRDQHNHEMLQLRVSLENALTRLDRKESECKQLEHQMKDLLQEKDSAMLEKSMIINNLKEHLDSAQAQSRELIDTIESLSAENNKLKKNNVADISNSLRTLNEKQELMKSLQKELEKSQAMHNKHLSEYDQLQASYADLRKQLLQSNEEMAKCKRELKDVAKIKEELESRCEGQKNEITMLRQECDKMRLAETEKRELEQKVANLEGIIVSLETKNTNEHAVQVSQFLNHSNISIAKEKEAREVIEQELNAAYETISKLKKELNENEEKISRKLVLEAEREKHIKALQEKALQFEKIIMERQSQPILATASTNTEKSYNDNELLQMKYEAELVEKEVAIRDSLKQEYDRKLDNLRAELEAARRSRPAELCNDCNKLKLKLNQYEVMLTDQSREVQSLKDQLNEDHTTVAEILDEWKEKFVLLETQNQQLAMRYTETKQHCDRLLEEFKKRDVEEAKRYSLIKKETEQAVKLWRRKTREEILKFALLQQDKVNSAQSRIEQFSRETEREIEAIERQYLQKTARR